MNFSVNPKLGIIPGAADAGFTGVGARGYDLQAPADARSLNPSRTSESLRTERSRSAKYGQRSIGFAAAHEFPKLRMV